MNKFGALTLLSVTALSLGLGGFITRAHAEDGLRLGADVNVNLSQKDNDQDNDQENENDKEDKKGGDERDGRMYKGGDEHRFTGITGTVTAISGTTITVKNNRDNTTYTVIATNTKIFKGPAVKTVADIKVGDFLLVEGAIAGTTVTASRILDTQFDTNFDFKKGIIGTVSASSGTTLMVTAKDGTVYTVATADAKFQKEKGAAIAFSDIKVGDTVLVQGTVAGTNVTAKNIFDAQIIAQKIEDRAGRDNGNHYGFFMRFGNFFKDLFKSRIHAVVSANIENHIYRLASYNGTAIPADQNYTLLFKDGSLSAKFCNSMNGSYSLKDGILSSALTSTMMACSDVNLMTMESSFSSALQNGATLTGDANMITLKSKTGATLVFAKQ